MLCASSLYAHNQMEEEPDIYKLDQHHRHRDIISNESGKDDSKNCGIENTKKLATILANLTTEKGTLNNRGKSLILYI